MSAKRDWRSSSQPAGGQICSQFEELVGKCEHSAMRPLPSTRLSVPARQIVAAFFRDETDDPSSTAPTLAITK